MKQSWSKVKIADLAHVARGGSPRPISRFITLESDGVNWIKIGDAEKGGRYIDSTEEKIRREGVRHSRWVAEGDFLLSNSMSFGRPYILRTSGCIHDGWLVLKPDYSRVDQGYLYYVLRSPDVFAQFDRQAAGSTVRNLNIDLVSAVTIPLPPLDEQKRIVAVLDQAFTALGGAQGNAEKNLADAKELLYAGLEAVIARNSRGGVEVALGDVCDFENGDRGENYPGRKAFVAQGVAFINAGHLDDGQIDWARMNYIPEEHFRRLSKGKVRKDDILFCLRGSLGKFGKVDRTDLGAIASSLVIVRAGHRIATDFLVLYFMSRQSKKMVDKFAGGAAQPNLSAADLKKFTIVLPGLDAQRKAIAEYKELLANAGQVRSSYEMKCGELDSLRKSLLQAAFSGQLT